VAAMKHIAVVSGTSYKMLYSRSAAGVFEFARD